MYGVLKVLNKREKFGVIKGSDNAEYKFDFKDFQGSIKHIYPGISMEFEKKSSTKAKNCSTRKNYLNQKQLYITPNEIFWSREHYVKGWETIESARWMITASGRGNPEDVKDLLKSYARRVGANAVVGVKYEATTGSENGTGNGTHYFTIHNFSAIPINIGKVAGKGIPQNQVITGINAQARELKDKYNLEYIEKKKNSKYWALFFLSISLGAFFLTDEFIVKFLAVFAGGGATIGALSVNDDGNWLQEL